MSDFNLFAPPPQNRYYLLGSSLRLHFNPFPVYTLAPNEPDIMAITREYFRQRMLEQFQSGLDQTRFLAAFDQLTNFVARGRPVRANMTVLDCFGAASRHAQQNGPEPASPDATLGDVVASVRRDPTFIQCVEDVRRRTTGLMDSILSYLPQKENPMEGMTRITISETLPGWGSLARTGIAAGRTALGRLREPGPVLSLLANNALTVSVPGLAETSVTFQFDESNVTTTITTRPLALIREFWSSALPPTVRDQIFTFSLSGQSPNVPGSPHVMQGMITLDVTALVRSLTGQR